MRQVSGLTTPTLQHAQSVFSTSCQCVQRYTLELLNRTLSRHRQHSTPYVGGYSILRQAVIEQQPIGILAKRSNFGAIAFLKFEAMLPRRISRLKLASTAIHRLAFVPPGRDIEHGGLSCPVLKGRPLGLKFTWPPPWISCGIRLCDARASIGAPLCSTKLVHMSFAAALNGRVSVSLQLASGNPSKPPSAGPAARLKGTSSWAT